MNGIIVFSVVILSMCVCCDGLNCDAKDKFAPCACKTTVTATNIAQGKKITTIEFQEVVCDEKENKRRMEKGAFGGNFFCHQLKEDITIIKDVKGMPVNVDVHRRNACELRCVDQCKL